MSGQSVSSSDKGVWERCVYHPKNLKIESFYGIFSTVSKIFKKLTVQKTGWAGAGRVPAPKYVKQKNT